MAVTQKSANDVREETTKRDTMRMVRAIARKMSSSPTQVSAYKPDRDGIKGFIIDHPTTPCEVFAKRDVSDDGWGYVWERIHVRVANRSIGMNRLMDIKRAFDYEVVDIWQHTRDETAEMGQHDSAAITFALEPRE